MSYLDSENKAGEKIFRELFDSYADRVHHYIFLMTKSTYLAEEVTQELFLILWRKRDDLENVQHLDGYVFRIARNLAIKLLQNAALDTKLAAELYQLKTDENPPMQDPLGSKPIQELVEKAIERLPPQPRKIYLLSREDNLNYDEIAALTGLSRNTIKNHLQRALNDIRSYLTQRGYTLRTLTILAMYLGCRAYEHLMAAWS